MRTIFILGVTFCFLRYVYSELQQEDFGSHLIKEAPLWHKKCVAITDIPPKMYEKIIKGIFEENPVTKSYVACIWLESKMVDLDFNVDEKLLEYFIPPKLPLLHEGYMRCFNKMKVLEKSFSNKTWMFEKCRYNMDPENYGFV